MGIENFIGGLGTSYGNIKFHTGMETSYGDQKLHMRIKNFIWKLKSRRFTIPVAGLLYIVV